MANYDEANPLVRILPCKGDRGVNTGATVVTSASDMTDTTKAYLYAGTTSGGYTKGHWYYWNGGEWKDGGDYTLAVLETEVDPESANAVQSQAIAAALEALEAQIPTIDATLAIEGAGADAKATGRRISELEVDVGGAFSLPKLPYLIGSGTNGTWSTSTGRHISIPINGGDVVSFTANANYSGVCAFLKSDNAASGVIADFCADAGGETWTERKTVTKDTTATYTAPSDCKILYVAALDSGGHDLLPSQLLINGADVIASIRPVIGELAETVEAHTQALTDLAIKENGVDRANFSLDKLSVTDNGYLILNSATGQDTHHNFVFCRSDGAITRFRFGAWTTSPYSVVRPFIVDSAGHKITFSILKSNASCTAYVSEAFSAAESVTAVKVADMSSIADGDHIFDVYIIGTTVLIYIDGVYVFRVTLAAWLAGCVTGAGFNYRAYGTSNQAAYKAAEMFCRSKFAHISFDDQLDCLKDITDNSYESIFESPYFSALKDAHDAYGAKFTLELFYQDAATNPTFALTGVTDSYKQEFIDNSGWLKFAYHGPDPTTKLNEMSDADLLTSFENMYTQIKRFAGRCNIDTTPRLSNFRCTRSQALALKSNGYITGYLAADDDRASNTGLSEAENAIAETHDIYTDFANGISYFRTGTRFDNGTAATVDAAIANILADEASRQNDSIYIIFAHSYTSELMISKLNALCEWCISRGLPFGYPFEHVEY